MSYYSDFYEPDPFADRNDDEQPSVATCKRCGKTGLHWDDDGDGRWVLMETEVRVHSCNMQKAALDDFEVCA